MKKYIFLFLSIGSFASTLYQGVLGIMLKDYGRISFAIISLFFGMLYLVAYDEERGKK